MMVIKFKRGTKEEEIIKIKKEIESLGVQAHISMGKEHCLLGVVGDATLLNRDQLKSNPNVEILIPIQEAYKLANRNFHPENSVINVLGSKVGGKNIAIMAGPCSVENEEQIIEVAKSVKESGATFLRGGAFKPRTSPYSFQGMGLDGLKLLNIAKKETGLPIVSELMSTSYLDDFMEMVDVIQIGARNMQNFELLKEIGKVKKPVLLKRGLSATIDELLMSAEYIMAGGNKDVILCERGIRTFENYTRNTLDLSAVPVIKRLSHLPIIIDPSHATGISWMVEPLSKAAIAVGADGLMIEVHNNPEKAKCDGAQSLRPEEFKKLMEKLKILAQIEEKII